MREQRRRPARGLRPSAARRRDRPRTGDAPRTPSEVDDQPVVRHRNAVGRRELDRPVGQQDPPVGGCQCLGGGEVAAGRAVVGAVGQRCLAEEQVGAAGQPRELLRRGGIARVRERRPVLGDPESVRGELVVGEPAGRDLEAPRSQMARRARTPPRTPRRTCCRCPSATRTPPGARDHPAEARARSRSGAPAGHRRSHAQGTRSPQWSRWKWVMAIERG